MNPSIVVKPITYAMQTLAKPLTLEANASAVDFRFWEMQDPSLLSQFLEELAIELECSTIEVADYADLPLGYGLLRFVFNFELACSCSSWLALENTGKEVMPLVAEYYAKAGLSSEAAAIMAAEKAWYEARAKACANDSEPYEAAGQAYRGVENAWQDEDKRRQHLVELLKSPDFWQC